ncbi:MAG: hypothetical protein ACTSX6_11685 [Candidatus Heimdallarchaeaceae archaeon]
MELKRRNKIWIFVSFIVVFFLSSSLVFAEQKLDVHLKIITYEIQDAYVVGDSFYYIINFTNTGNETINDTFTISIFNPSRNLIDSPRKYKIFVKQNKSELIIAKGGKENETAAFPFDTSGDYKLELNATKLIDFYRWIQIREGNFLYKRYIRQNKNFNYFFDVMPHWQYNLWKSSEEANQKVIEANQKLLNLTVDLNNATQSMKTASWIMVIVAGITLFIAYKTYKSPRG